jgi:hypothetical protein
MLRLTLFATDADYEDYLRRAKIAAANRICNPRCECGEELVRDYETGQYYCSICG